MKSLDYLLEELREKVGIKTIWRDDPVAGLKIVRAIKNGHVVAALIDQDVQLENSFTPFFGIDAAYPVLPIKIALKYQLPVFSTFIVRTAPLKHWIVSEEIHYKDVEGDKLDYIIKTFNERLEELICMYPEQWMWWHRRWRRRPGVDYLKEPAKLRSSEAYLDWLGELTRKAQGE